MKFIDALQRTLARAVGPGRNRDDDGSACGTRGLRRNRTFGPVSGTRDGIPVRLRVALLGRLSSAGQLAGPHDLGSDVAHLAVEVGGEPDEHRECGGLFE